ncbi:MAG: PHP domain-containing protein [Gemmatimonadales bacterium]|jgi:putative hydrolase
MRANHRFVRYSELTPGWVNREMHLHTEYTDGEASIAEVIQRAESLGLAEIAFTEHVRADSAWFPEFADEVRRRAAGCGVRVLVGAEVRIKDFEGSLDITPEIREHCDIVLASVHRFPGSNGSLRSFADVPRGDFAEIEYRLARGFVKRGGADVLAHPGGMSLRQTGTFPDAYFRSLMAECRERGVAIEISSSYLRDLSGFLNLLEEVDPLVSIGSDAHRLDEIGSCKRMVSEKLWAN